MKTRPLCPKCGQPARVAVVINARIRCALEADGSVGRVLSISKDTSPPISFECGGKHFWAVG